MSHQLFGAYPRLNNYASRRRSAPTTRPTAATLAGPRFWDAPFALALFQVTHSPSANPHATVLPGRRSQEGLHTLTSPTRRTSTPCHPPARRSSPRPRRRPRNRRRKSPRSTPVPLGLPPRLRRARRRARRRSSATHAPPRPRRRSTRLLCSLPCRPP